MLDVFKKTGRINRNCRGSEKSLPLIKMLSKESASRQYGIFIPYVPSAASGTSFLLTAEEKEAKKTATPTPT